MVSHRAGPSDLSCRRRARLHGLPSSPKDARAADFLAPVAPLTFHPRCSRPMSFLSYVAGASTWRAQPPRRLHVNHVGAQQPRASTPRASHKRLMQQSGRCRRDCCSCACYLGFAAKRWWATVTSAPPECCIAGADGQPWPYASVWPLAFRSAIDTRRGPACCSVGANRQRSGARSGCSLAAPRRPTRQRGRRRAARSQSLAKQPRRPDGGW